MPAQPQLLIAMAVYTALLLLIFRLPVFAFLDKAEKGRDAHLDGLRFFLAIAVVYHHSVFSFRYWNGFGWNEDGYVIGEKFGRYAVAGFFMLSAYLFSDRRFGTLGIYAVFFAKRCLRILPLAYFTSAICIALALYLNRSLSPEQTPINPRFWRDLLIAPFFPYVGTFAIASTFNAGVMWTLTYEWGLYLSLPIISWLRRLIGPIAVSASATLIFAWLAQSHLPVNAKFIVCFPIGFLARDLKGKFFIPQSMSSALVLVLLWRVFYSGSNVFNIENFILLGVLFVLITNGTTIFGLLVSRAAVRLGEASFSIYLLHGIFLFFLNKWITPQQVSHLHYQPFLFLTFVAICAASTFTFHFIEAPFLGISRGLKPDAIRKILHQHI
jgi:peptidoglycan/LPS O-acetylase OafA/YrhL